MLRPTEWDELVTPLLHTVVAQKRIATGKMKERGNDKKKKETKNQKNYAWKSYELSKLLLQITGK